MTVTIKELLPEIDWISDEVLKSQVIKTFEDSLREGGWKDPKDLLSTPFTATYEAYVPYITHVRGVTRLAAAMYDEYYGLFDKAYTIELNRDHLVAGALLHDVGKLYEMTIEPDGIVKKSDNGKYIRHAFTGFSIAFQNGLPLEVAHIIAVHSRDGDASKRSPLAEIVRKADQTVEYFALLDVEYHHMKTS